MPSPVIVDVRQRTPEWLAAREHGIGASEAAASVGLSQWESRVGLWARKLGLVPPDDETIPMRMGAGLEPLIADLYSEQTGIKIRRANQLRRHPTHEFMLASLDRRAGRKPVELKWSMRGTGYGEPGTDEVPDEVLAQVLHQLAVTDEPEGDVAVLIGSRDFRIYTVVRDDEAERALIEAEAEFWRHVEARTEPPLDASEATARALAARYPRDDGTTVEADDRLRQAMRDLRAARELLERAEADQALARAVIELGMGEATRVVAAGLGEITWKTTKDREATDWKAVASAYRSELDRLVDPELTADLDAIASLHTTTTPGSRRFVPKWDQEED